VTREDAGGEAAPAGGSGQAQGAQVIDLAELLSRSIKATGKPGPAKAKSEPGETEERAAADAEAEAGKSKPSKKAKRASG
jgi:hypothetical protein